MILYVLSMIFIYEKIDLDNFNEGICKAITEKPDEMQFYLISNSIDLKH